MAELEYELQRLEVAERQLRDLDRERREELARGEHPTMKMISMLMGLRAMGVETATLLTLEFFGWRDLKNRRAVASAAGLAPTPYSSGSSEREQGISKAGSKRVRRVMVEFAWLWLRHQPQSASAQWYERKYGDGSKRSRRIGIVGLARRLLVEFWRFATQGVAPDGAEFKPEPAQC